MTKVEYIRASHRQTNRKLREWLDGVHWRLDDKNHMLGWLWWLVAWIIFGVVYLVSWLSFVDSLFRDVRFTLHYMECEIGDLSPAQVRPYLLNKQKEYTRRLSYGSVSMKEQKRIDKTFEYLFSLYPAPAEEFLPDMAAERHTQVMDGFADVKSAVENVASNTDRMSREDVEHHMQVIGRIDEVKTVVESVAAYTDRKGNEDTERQQKEAEAFAAAEKRRERHRSRSGFEHNPEDFCPKLSDTQITLLTKHINEIGVFRLDVTAEEITRLFLCEHIKPLQTTHNKIIALLLEKLCAEGLITPKWQRVAEHHKCFTSKMGKPLTAKDLSSAKQLADFIAPKKYDMITDCIDEVKRSK